MTDNRFGPIVTGLDVLDKTEAHIRAWFRTYIAEIAYRSGRARGDLPPFKSYAKSTTIDHFVEDQLPSCVLAIMDNPKTYRHRGIYRTDFDLRVGAFVKGQNDDNSIELAMLYGAAVSTLLVQKPTLGGDPRLESYAPFAVALDWEGTQYNLVDFEDTRTLGASEGMFTVTVDGVVDSHQGPSEPIDEEDPGDWPTVDPAKISVTVDKEQ